MRLIEHIVYTKNNMQQLNWKKPLMNLIFGALKSRMAKTLVWDCEWCILIWHGDVTQTSEGVLQQEKKQVCPTQRREPGDPGQLDGKPLHCQALK